MNAAFCSPCGHRAEPEAQFCSACGRALDVLPDDEPMTGQFVPVVEGAEDAALAEAPQTGPWPATPTAPIAPADKMVMPYFPVAIHKLLVMSVCTLGLYQLYWAYQHWKRIKLTTGDKLSPFWRALFGTLWALSLFRRIRVSAEDVGPRAR